MSRPRQADLVALIEALNAGAVEFIVIGGGAAVLHGAGITTEDLDIVPRQTPENAARLMAVLEELDAVIREPMNRGLRPRASDFLGTGQLNLWTRLGPLDPLCRLHDGRGYADLFEHTELLADQDLVVRVLDLPTLIAVKASIGRAKDRLALPILLALLDER